MGISVNGRTHTSFLRGHCERPPERADGLLPLGFTDKMCCLSGVPSSDLERKEPNRVLV